MNQITLLKIGDKDPFVSGEIETQHQADYANALRFWQANPNECEAVKLGIESKASLRARLLEYNWNPLAAQMAIDLCMQATSPYTVPEYYGTDGVLYRNQIMIQQDAFSEPSIEQEGIVPPDFPPIDNDEIKTIVPTPVPQSETEPTRQYISSQPSEQSCPAEITHCRGVIAAVSELTTEIGKAVLEPIGKLINDAIAPIAHVQNVVIGQLQNRLNNCEENLGKCQLKALKPIRQGLGECYGYMSQCGCCYPSPEQVVYGLETGKYMESVGISPPGSTIDSHDVQSSNNTTNIYASPSGDGIVNIIPTPAGQLKTEPEPPIGSVNVQITGEPITVEGIQYYPLIGGLTPQANPIPGFQLPAKIPEPPLPGPPSLAPDEKVKKQIAEVGRVPDWQHPKVCEELKKPAAAATAGEVSGFIIGPDGKKYAPAWFMSLAGPGQDFGIGALGSKIRSGLWELFHGLSDTLDSIIADFKTIFRCDQSIPVDAVVAKVLMGLISNWTNGSLDELQKGFDYKLNESCPQQIPSQSDIDNAALSNQMSAEQWECLTKANNNLPELAKQVFMSKRTRIDWNDIYKLYKLGKIKDEDMIKWTGDAGIMTGTDLQLMLEAKVDVPAVSDLIRMMVRDVADESIVREYQLDNEFDNKWKEQLEKFGESQGITREVAKYHWRAHWDYPSTFQSFDMLHRLRPDSPFAQRIAKESADRHLANGTKNPGIFTTSEDIQKLLEVNDMAWFWRERMQAISYRPLTRTDAQRAFQIGALTEDELLGVYQDEGYALENARILVNFTKQLVAERNFKRPLPPRVNKAIKYYLDGIHTINQLEDYLNFYRVDDARQKDILKYARDERKMIIYKNNIDCIRRAYMLGAHDDVQAKAALVNIGMDAALAGENVDLWWCKKKGKAREVSAAKLCEWREKKLITSEQQLRRLVNLGYSVDDATKIVQECESDISERAYKRIIAELKKSQAEAEKAAKAAEKREAQAFRAAKAASKNGVA